MTSNLNFNFNFNFNLPDSTDSTDDEIEPESPNQSTHASSQSRSSSMPINLSDLIRTSSNQTRNQQQTFIESGNRSEGSEISSAINLDVSDISSIFQLLGMFPSRQQSSDTSTPASTSTSNTPRFNTQMNPQDITGNGIGLGQHGVVQLEISGITTTFFNSSDSSTINRPSASGSGVTIHQLLNDTSLVIASDSTDVCSICNESMENGSIIRKINRCNHCFHDRCINRWFISHSTCPMCRAGIST